MAQGDFNIFNRNLLYWCLGPVQNFIYYVKNILQKIFFSFFTLEEHQSKSKLAKVLQKLTFLDELEEKQDVRKYRTLDNV